MERVSFEPASSPDTYGFVNPKHVIRACHLIPAFTYGRATENSVGSDTEDDWRYYHVNRFVNHDMFARFAGLGIGHLNARAKGVEVMSADTDLTSLERSITVASNTDISHEEDEEDEVPDFDNVDVDPDAIANDYEL